MKPEQIRNILPLFLIMTGCTVKPASPEIFSAIFSRHEFIPSRGIGADGWAEARRRRLFGAYLEQRGISYTMKQIADSQPPGSKYRQVQMTLPGSGTEPSAAVTLALTPQRTGRPDASFHRQQARCDAQLSEFLKQLDIELSRRRAVDFIQTETCIGLTP